MVLKSGMLGVSGVHTGSYCDFMTNVREKSVDTLHSLWLITFRAVLTASAYGVFGNITDNALFWMCSSKSLSGCVRLVCQAGVSGWTTIL